MGQVINAVGYCPTQRILTKVMDIDPFVLAEESPSAILNGKILMTIVGGNIVYER